MIDRVKLRSTIIDILAQDFLLRSATADAILDAVEKNLAAGVDVPRGYKPWQRVEGRTK